MSDFLISSCTLFDFWDDQELDTATEAAEELVDAEAPTVGFVPVGDVRTDEQAVVWYEKDGEA